MQLGRDLAELTAGLDALYREANRNSGFLDQEGLIPVAVAEVAPRPLRDYAEARDAVTALQGRVPAEAESGLRHDYLLEMTDSLLALITTFEAKDISYAERLRRQMRVAIDTVDDATLAAYRATIREKLEEIGRWTGDIAHDVRRWEVAVRVPPEAVIDTMRAYTKEVRARVTARMFDMAHEWIEPVELRGVPFSAYCDYPGRRQYLNLAYPYTSYALKHMAAHETFPGHLVHLALRERYVADGTMPLDGAQVVTSSASSAVFEGIADNGLFFTDWVETPEDELAIALQRLRAALNCNAAWMLHAEDMDPDEVAAVIAAAGYEDAAITRAKLGFLQHDLRAPFIYAYWCGDTAVHAVWRTVTPDRRADFFAHLYGHVHTPATLRDHWAR